MRRILVVCTAEECEGGAGGLIQLSDLGGSVRKGRSALIATFALVAFLSGCSWLGFGGDKLPAPNWARWNPGSENAMAVSLVIESDNDDHRPVIDGHGNLLFDSDRDGNTDIWLYNPLNGGGVQQLTTSSEPDMYPSLHPNGRNFIFLSNRTGEGAHYFMGTLGAPTAEVLVQVTRPEPGTWTPAFVSPDGSRLVYSSGGFIWILNLNTRTRTQLFQGTGPSWTPDGERILFRRKARDFGRYVSTSVWAANADGTRATELIPGNDEISLSEARMSPDRTRICFTLREVVNGPKGLFGRGDIWIANPDGSRQVQLTNAPGHDEECTWEDNSTILFASDRPPTGGTNARYWNIWRARLPR